MEPEDGAQRLVLMKGCATSSCSSLATREEGESGRREEGESPNMEGGGANVANLDQSGNFFF